ncbi:cytidylate kinase family protein [Ramlibacter tataouinensis]|uniref:cytidylate kinase family protein n=1 Tax=Ramlibacter tataouinensis TaxID=94132 RepID=UPI0022F3CE39|nr:cytidylate kinase family protein [Ramlibacter tataouinensis]WBY02975.1 cytidylate kinase family protein [Ramlibacter tataouinensis]
MPVIALTQEMGSLAKNVALRLGELAGLQVMRHEVAENVAGRMHVETSLIHRLRGGKASLRERFSTDRQQVAVFTAEEVFALARGGNIVLRGWGATLLLRPVPHVVCVRITRPFEQRVDWLMENLETTDREAAQAEVRRSDDAHANRMRAQFGVTWGDPLLYDLVINTERVSVDSAASQILALAAAPEFRETDASHACLEGLALSARVRAALKADEVTSGTNIGIEAAGGKVVLTGLVLNEQERDAAARVAGAVAGASSVENRLRIMAVSRKFTHSKT